MKYQKAGFMIELLFISYKLYVGVKAEHLIKMIYVVLCHIINVIVNVN